MILEIKCFFRDLEEKFWIVKKKKRKIVIN